MKRLQKIALVLLTIYSLVLLSIEFRTSQDYVRNYFTDIEGPVRFYAINTTFSVALLWGTALIFALCLFCLDNTVEHRKTSLFYRSQVFIFLLLGLDDRFLLHENIGWILNRNDAFILAGLGVLEVLFLFFWGNLDQQSKKMRSLLSMAALLFVAMVFIDQFLPSEMVLRLSLEDLSKVWSEAFLFLFALEFYIGHITQLKQHRYGSSGSD
jgi:hypothetical protein